MSRLAHLSWDELRTRVGQEFNKRLDLARYAAGFDFTGKALGPVTEPRGTFLIPTEQVAARAQLLREHLPSAVEAIIRQADAICEHRFSLLGYEDLKYGKEIDWHRDAVHGKRAPLKPWFKIDFLDFNQVGDHKVTWELNRHQHLVALAKAWCLSGDERYVNELMAQWYSWQRANPYPLGINWASSLEVAFRSLSWLWVRNLLATCPLIPATFWTDLSRALALNGRYLEKYLSTYFSPNTHLLGEVVALFFIGTLAAEQADSERWASEGWKIVVQEAERQVRPDGVYFEQAFYYHVYALDFFLHARTLAARNEIEIPVTFDNKLERMLEVLRAVFQAGPVPGFGDDDGGRVFDPRRNQAEHMTDPLALGAVIFGKTGIGAAGSLTEEAMWMFGQQAVSRLSEPQTTPAIAAAPFPAGGVYVMASGGAHSQQMVIDAGPQGVGQSGHGHADALSFTLSVDGRPWLVDPGTFCYISDDNQRNSFRGTGAHNTLRVDGLDQAVPEGPFAWSAIPEIRAERWIAGNTFTLFAGSHNGYQRLSEPVLHRRHVFHLHGGFFLVSDVIEGGGVHDIETTWHFAPGLRVEECEGAIIALPLSTAPRADRLALIPAEQSGWKSEISEAEVSPAYGKKELAAVLRVHRRAELPCDGAVLLSAMTEPGKIGKLLKDVPEKVARFTYEQGATRHDMVFALEAQQSWNAGPWSSDAQFLYGGFAGNRLVHMVAGGASFIKVHGKAVFVGPEAIERVEWRQTEAGHEIFSSDREAVRFFDQAALESFDSVVPAGK